MAKSTGTVSAFSIGDRVFHQKFGNGNVRHVEGNKLVVDFDHAGGLLKADGSRAFPRASIVAQRAEWEIALGDNPRLVASYVQPELQLVRDWGSEGWAEGEKELLPGVTAVPTGGHSAGHQAVVVRAPGAEASMRTS